jgi:RNA-directed DNA polymerase
LIILCKSKRSANRTLENILPYIEGKLFLKVNRQKTTVDYIGKVKFLGFTFYRYKGVTRVRIHPKTITKMKNKIRELTARNNGWGNEYRIMKLKLDEWMRRRIRMIYWKQWKRVKTRFTELKHLGIDENKAWEYANTRKGYWRISNSHILNTSLNNQTLANRGYLFFSDYYRKVCVN